MDKNAGFFVDTIAEEPPAYCKCTCAHYFHLRNIMFSCSMLQNLLDSARNMSINYDLRGLKGMSYSPRPSPAQYDHGCSIFMSMSQEI